MASKGIPEVLFGAGGIGNTESSFTYTWTTPEKTAKFLDLLKELGLTHLDSAASYPPGNPWHTETLLGQAKAAEKGFLIDSKIAAYKEVREIALTEKNIDFSIDKTLQLLGLSKVNVMYTHFPNDLIPIEETMRAFDKNYRAGKFNKLGMCNYTYDQMKELLEVCEKHGYVKPTAYQGHFNALWRVDEEKLYPLLREHGIKIFAYSPLAGGFLTGKVTFDKEISSGSVANISKLSDRNRWQGESAFEPYAFSYGKENIHAAIRQLQHKLQTLPEANGMSLAEASLRWIRHHSILGEGDGLIIGATREQQVIDNVEALRKGPLPDSVRDAVEELWAVSKGENLAFSFWEGLRKTPYQPVTKSKA